MAIFSPTKDTSRGFHLLQRKYLGNGLVYHRAICKGIRVGDIFTSSTYIIGNKLIESEVVEIISISDGKSDQLTDEQEKDAHVEFICKIPFNPPFVSEMIPYNFGN